MSARQCFKTSLNKWIKNLSSWTYFLDGEEDSKLVTYLIDSKMHPDFRDIKKNKIQSLGISV